MDKAPKGQLGWIGRDSEGILSFDAPKIQGTSGRTKRTGSPPRACGQAVAESSAPAVLSQRGGFEIAKHNLLRDE